MADPDSATENITTPDRAKDAQKYLASEFERCRASLVDFEQGVEAMREGQAAFDALWAETVKNAGRIYGRGATREALERLGRAEDVQHMY